MHAAERVMRAACFHGLKTEIVVSLVRNAGRQNWLLVESQTDE